MSESGRDLQDSAVQEVQKPYPANSIQAEVFWFPDNHAGRCLGLFALPWTIEGLALG